MNPPSFNPAAMEWPTPQTLLLSGAWTAREISKVAARLDVLLLPAETETIIDSAGIEALDMAGAWVLQKFLHKMREQGRALTVRDLHPEFANLLAGAAHHLVEQRATHTDLVRPTDSLLEATGRRAIVAIHRLTLLLGFVGESTVALARCVAQPARFRLRPVLHHIRSAGFDALPIVGLLSFLLGVVIAYQGADQLRQYGANIYVADLVGLSMLREFAPLITAIIVAGRSGSSYAAQIGTMAVTEEIDAMRTIGIDPIEMLVLPKFIALLIAMPLLTVFADVLGTLGGMVMAQTQLGVGYTEFLGRFVKTVSVSTYMVGIGKAPIFAAIVAVVGCFQGFQTAGGPDSVGRQTTRSVVQAIFLVIVADALFSIAFSALGL